MDFKTLLYKTTLQAVCLLIFIFIVEFFAIWWLKPTSDSLRAATKISGKFVLYPGGRRTAPTSYLRHDNTSTQIYCGISFSGMATACPYEKINNSEVVVELAYYQSILGKKNTVLSISTASNNQVIASFSAENLILSYQTDAKIYSIYFAFAIALIYWYSTVTIKQEKSKQWQIVNFV